ncbi:MAG: ABC transporter substrate binding protein, partial [Xanthobacteraceae bacterium]
MGLVASLNRPGANVTGIANLSAEVAPKRLQLLRELMPNAALFGVLVDPAYSVTQSTIADLHAAARTLGLQLAVVNARTDGDLETAFATFSQQRIGAILVGTGTLFARRTEQLAALAAKAATTTIPIVFTTGGDPVALGLVASLNRPSANVTGMALLQAELAPKQLQLLRELIPNAARFGVLADLANPVTQSTIADLQAAARTLGLQLVVA